MSFDRRYALLSRIFLWAVGVSILSMIILFGIHWYGNLDQAVQIMEIYSWYKWYAIIVIISVWYAISSRGWWWIHTTILYAIWWWHAFFMMTYILIVISSIPVILYSIILWLLIVCIGFARWSFRPLRLISIVSWCWTIILFIFSLIPLYPHQIGVSSWFNVPKLYLTIQYRDTAELLRNAQAQVWIYSGTDMRTIDLVQMNNTPIALLSGQTVVYASTTPTISTWISIHHRDGSVISLTPQTSITISDMSMSDRIDAYSTTNTINQGIIVFSQYLNHDRNNAWMLFVDDDTSTDCRRGIIDITPTRIRVMCQEPWNTIDVLQEVFTTGAAMTGTSMSNVAITSNIIYSGMIYYQQQSTWRSIVNQTGYWLSGYNTIMSYHDIMHQDYRKLFEQRLTVMTSWWLSPSALWETIVWYKFAVLYRLWPDTYIQQYTAYNTYLFIKWVYQSWLIDRLQLKWLGLIRQ